MSDLIVSLPRPHAGQQKILSERKRFNVLRMGRRFGKTTLSGELISEMVPKALPVGYWAPTYKDLYEVWQETKFRFQPILTAKDEQVKQLRFLGGCKVDFWSMEDPDSGRGRKYGRAICDECEKAPKFQQAWEQTIRPSLADYQGDAYFSSTPKGSHTYFTQLYNRAETLPDWMAWTMPTIANPYILPEEIEQARKELPDLIFRQEFLGESISLTDKPFCFAFDVKKHVGKVERNYNELIKLSFDFNVNPITCGAYQDYDNKIRGLKSFEVPHSNIYELCDRIKITYPDAIFLVTGDATGQNTTALVRDALNFYHVILGELGISHTQLRVPGVNPKIEENQVLVNAIFEHADIMFDKDECDRLIYDCLYVEMDSNKKIVKDRSTDKKYADHLDHFRYFCNTFYGDFLRIPLR